jgi:hypothetical protein
MLFFVPRYNNLEKKAFALVITSPKKKKKKKKTHLRLWNRNGGDDDVESDILQYLCATRDVYSNSSVIVSKKKTI